MLEMIPNWHPVAVHFAIALLFTAVLQLLLGRLMHKFRSVETLMLVGKWNLWLGAFAAAWAAASGWLAYNSVAHDAVAHQAMTIHMWWAIPTATLFVVLATWLWIRRVDPRLEAFPIVLLCLGALALLQTGYLGAENVYRYGLGVESTPALRSGSEPGSTIQDVEQQHADSPDHTH